MQNTKDIDAIARRLYPVFTGYDVKGAVLFGSYAKGTYSEKLLKYCKGMSYSDFTIWHLYPVSENKSASGGVLFYYSTTHKNISGLLLPYVR